MKYYLGIDGGGTKTSFLVADENGTVISTSTSGTCHYLQCGLDGVTKVIKEGLDKIDVPIAYAFVGCAGYGDVESDKKPVEDAVKAAMGDIPHSIGNDCENALAGGLAGQPGINIIAGTGSMACGTKDGINSIRCGGWHHGIGSDEGSAYWMGYRLLHEFTRQSDGRDPKTPLYEKIKEHLGLTTDDEIIVRVVEEWKLDREKIASIAPLLAPLIKEEDPFAEEILTEAADELADLAVALNNRLGFTENTPVTCTGGVFKMGQILTLLLNERLKKHNMHYERPQLEPVAGAVILAMMHDGITINSQITYNLD